MSQLKAIQRWEEAEKHATKGPWKVKKFLANKPWKLLKIHLEEWDSLIFSGAVFSYIALVNTSGQFVGRSRRDAKFISAARAVDPAAIRRLVEAAKEIITLKRERMIELENMQHNTHGARFAELSRIKSEMVILDTALAPFLEDDNGRG